MYEEIEGVHKNYLYEYDGIWGISYNDISNVTHGSFQDIIMNEPSLIYNKKFLKKWNGKKILIDINDIELNNVSLHGLGSINWNPSITKNDWNILDKRKNFLKHPRNS